MVPEVQHSARLFIHGEVEFSQTVGTYSCNVMLEDCFITHLDHCSARADRIDRRILHEGEIGAI